MPTATSTAFGPTAPTPSTETSTLPSGSTFDLIPPALSALERVLASPNFVPSASNPASSNGIKSSTNASAKSQHATNGASSPLQHQSPSTQQSLQQPSLKDLPELMLAARHKIQAARDTVRALPDIEKSIGQQEAEIRWVEQRIERLKGIWEGVRQEAAIKAREGNDGKGEEAVVEDGDEKMVE